MGGTKEQDESKYRGQTFEQRLWSASQLKIKYQDRVPVVVLPYKSYPVQRRMSQEKFLVPVDITVAQFLLILRKKMTLKPEETLFLFAESAGGKKKSLLSATDTIGTVYDSCHEPDMFLYLVYSQEDAFGWIWV